MKNISPIIWQYIWPISPIEIILTIFALFAWSRAILRFRIKMISQKEFIFWTIVWLSAIMIVFIPGKTTALALLLGMKRGLDAMVFIAIIVLFYTVYRLYVKVNETEIEITKLVRQIALNSKVKKSVTQRKIKK